jgi:hypothetical protein
MLVSPPSIYPLYLDWDCGGKQETGKGRDGEKGRRGGMGGAAEIQRCNGQLCGVGSGRGRGLGSGRGRRRGLRRNRGGEGRGAEAHFCIWGWCVRRALHSARVRGRPGVAQLLPGTGASHSEGGSVGVIARITLHLGVWPPCPAAAEPPLCVLSFLPCVRPYTRTTPRCLSPPPPSIPYIWIGTAEGSKRQGREGMERRDGEEGWVEQPRYSAVMGSSVG